MRRFLPWLLFLLSLGINVGVFATLGVARFLAPPASETDPAAGAESKATDEPSEEPTPDAAPAEPDSGVPAPEPPTGQEQRIPPAAAVRLGRLADHLGLSGREREGFLSLQRTFLREVQQRRGELERLQLALQREVMSDAPEPNVIRARLDQMGAAYAQLDAAFVQNVLRSRDYLNADQQKRFNEFLGRMRTRAQSGESSPPARGRRGRRPGFQRSP